MRRPISLRFIPPPFSSLCHATVLPSVEATSVALTTTSRGTRGPVCCSYMAADDIGISRWNVGQPNSDGCKCISGWTRRVRHADDSGELLLLGNLLAGVASLEVPNQTSRWWDEGSGTDTAGACHPKSGPRYKSRPAHAAGARAQTPIVETNTQRGNGDDPRSQVARSSAAPAMIGE